MIGERIRQARKMKGLSLRDLAKEVGLSAQALSNYERGQDVPSSDILLRLAKVLGRKVEFFLRPQRVVEIEPAYRKKSSLSVSKMDTISAIIKEWLERYLQIEEIIHDSDIGFQYPQGFPQTVGDLEAVESAAIHLRQAWDVGLDPIANLTELLEDKGIKVGEVECEQGFDGCAFYAKVDGEVPVIVCTNRTPGDRQRFTLAHELGHLMLTTNEGLDIEKAANRFAGAFLVPKPAVLMELGPMRSSLNLTELHLLKHKYGLSVGAWIYRARDVGVINDRAATYYFQMFKQRGWHKQEPGDAYPRETTQRMYRMVLHAYSQQIVSERKAEDLLGMNWSEFERRITEEHGGFEFALHNGQ